MIDSKGLAPNDLGAMDDEQLTVKLKDAKQELFSLHLAQATGQPEDHGRIRAVCRDVTRIYTIYREHELGIRTEPSVKEQAMTKDVMRQAERNHRRVRRGHVISNKMKKTIVVRLEGRKKHPLYGKVMRKTKKVKVHDEHNAAGIGDLVVIMKTRPLSATKHWCLVEIAEKTK